MPRLLPLKVGNSMGNVGGFGSFGDLLIPDSNTQINAKHWSLHCSLSDFEPSSKAHCEWPFTKYPMIYLQYTILLPNDLFVIHNVAYAWMQEAEVRTKWRANGVTLGQYRTAIGWWWCHNVYLGGTFYFTVSLCKSIYHWLCQAQQNEIKICTQNKFNIF